MSKIPTVIVGMSGGVDSSVVALLLKQQGYRVIGLFMKNWDEKNERGVCPAALEYEDVARVCDKLDIPYYSINFVKEYWENVFAVSLKEFQAGYTPNPDILCNREIKFKVFFDKAMELGGDFLATGHYCQTQNNQLLKGLDPEKDQSYFLYTIKENILKKVLFPIGHLQKKEVREIARKYDLPTSDKKDSTGICFIGERNFKEFLKQFLKPNPGHFEDLKGKILGSHEGIAYYTIGQRKGLGIGGAGEAWFVVNKDYKRNVVILAQGNDHPSLYQQSLIATDLTWVSDKILQLPLNCKAKVRYRQEDQACTIHKTEEGKLFVSFALPQRAITPRQSIVFYDNEVCLGGGMIQ